jgi:protein TonB
MFADSMLETSWAHRGRRSWTTLTSFGLQAVVLGLLLLIPILGTVGVPLARVASTPISMGRPDAGPVRTPDRARDFGVQVVPQTGRLMMPNRIPHTIPLGDGPFQDAPIGGGGAGIGDVGISGNNPLGVPVPIGGSQPVMPVHATPSVREFRPSNLLQGSLIHRVEPVYPPLARSARIQGAVVLEAVIGKDGAMENLRLISGHPMLAPAAIQAVSQWRYRPYILNGEAVEVETQITVNFILGGN